MPVKRPNFDPWDISKALNLKVGTVIQALNGGHRCPYCHGNVQIYPRSVNCDIARALILSYKLYKANPGKWMNLSKYLTKKHGFRSGDYHKAAYWKLLERCPEKRPYGKSSSGRWRITKLGLRFVEREYVVPQSHCLEYLHQPIPGCWYGGPRGIVDALGRNWNYDKLMAGDTDTDP